MVSELYTNTTACTQDGFTVTSDKWQGTRTLFLYVMLNINLTLEEESPGCGDPDPMLPQSCLLSLAPVQTGQQHKRWSSHHSTTQKDIQYWFQTNATTHFMHTLW
jgi:hypothetical protein